MISSKILKFASFFPTYWLVEANKIVDNNLGIEKLTGPYSIMILQTIVFLALYLLISGRKSYLRAFKIKILRFII